MIRLSGIIQPMDMTDQNDMVDYVIEPLTFKYLLPALRLVDSVFPRREQGGERADLAFTASLLTLGRRIAKWMGYPMVRYWIVRDVATNRIYGTIGHYVRADDPDAYWGGWMCVDPRARGLGIGKKLINFVVGESVRRGDRPYHRFYTSTDPNEAKAVAMYNRACFNVYKQECDPVTGYTRLYYQVRLDDVTLPVL
ncbi:MAG TPA: GNAT family N-acetyltransferase [Smithella sp.]|nr:GNAT family N-acetyltransferase [Syntrophaceae bacterium]HOG10742.1 GNAT family N-acetyltransferase [Smithella sp.]HOO36104.1 GNAT family N-acetyltransferase [Smithella sp.]HOX99458.1 GNAT family N-acetyltransferase [Smithella sp.]HPH56312.1 GNAT family N-acetyltransferase [Smithella sp.]